MAHTQHVSAASAPEGNGLAITADDLYLLGRGEWYRSYDKLGAHPCVEAGERGYRFAVWAPDVRAVQVVGDFNGWDVTADPLAPTRTGGVWQGFVAGIKPGDLYKFHILTQEGEELYKADPYAFAAELTPGTASRACAEPSYAWGDGAWMERRSTHDHMSEPLNIYEVHLGSWRRHGDEPQGEPREDGTYPGPLDEFPAQRGKFYTYDDLADELVAYVSEMGYTHVELLPVMEHPFDGSWGYQTTGYFAPTARYGAPEHLMHLVDAFHQAGIGVILDWVPGGFCADAQGLASFNGGMLYEREIHPNWGTHKFDFARGEVRSFLISNVLYWLERFHADGIRMDGVSSMLYLNFGVDDPREKKFNERGTEEDLDASAFIRQCNTVVSHYFPDVMMIAEESTAWPLVTYPPEDGGLGFHYKWDMGWMNDTLHYMQTDFPWRPGNHRLITFSMMYAFNENFVLPLSHDEVVHGKCSLIGRMPGDWWRQFAGMRALAFYQMMHPGAKLNFMGNEIAQFIEWRYYESIQWFLTDEYETHRSQQHFIAALNRLYRERPALWQRSYDWSGFEWIDADDSEQSIVSFVRRGEGRDDELVILVNFDPACYDTFRMGVPREGDWVEVFNSDAAEFGGSGKVNGDRVLSSEPYGWNGRENSIELTVPPLGGVVLERRGPSSYVPPKRKELDARYRVRAKATRRSPRKAAPKKPAKTATAAAGVARTAKAAKKAKAAATTGAAKTKTTNKDQDAHRTHGPGSSGA